MSDIIFSWALIIVMAAWIFCVLRFVYLKNQIFPTVLYPKRPSWYRRAWYALTRHRWGIVMTTLEPKTRHEWHHTTRLGAKFSAWRAWRLFDGANRQGIITLSRLKS